MVAATSLSVLQDQEDLTNTLLLVSRESANAIATTALQLHDASYGKLDSFVSEKVTLLAPNVSVPDASVLDYLCDLTLSAEKAAVSAACSSILLGQTSESDYLGDVAIWLGQATEGFTSNNPQNVLNALELDKWANHNITPVPLETEAQIPAPTASLPKTPAMETFVNCVGTLENRHCFRVTRPGCEGCVVAFFLIGKVQGKGWGGLCGMGTWSDVTNDEGN